MRLWVLIEGHLGTGRTASGRIALVAMLRRAAGRVGAAVVCPAVKAGGHGWLRIRRASDGTVEVQMVMLHLRSRYWGHRNGVRAARQQNIPLLMALSN